MRGFFDDEELSKFDATRSGITACSKCGLYRGCRSPKMPVGGKGKKSILVIAEAPGHDEDLQGTQLVGPAGRELKDALRKVGIDLEEDCWKINSVNCRPKDNRNPTPDEVNHCRPMVWKTIYDLKPRLIILLGNIAVQAFLSHRWKRNLPNITSIRGWTFPDYEAECWVAATLHPSYVMRTRYNDTMRLIWTQDLGRAVQKSEQRLPQFKEPKDCVRVLKPLEGAKLCNRLIEKPPKYLAFDYETTGLKPYNQGHGIACISFAPSTDVAFSFMVPEFGPVKDIVARVLRETPSRKIASNMRFEDTWSQIILGTEVKNWFWDTMLAAHVLDQRPGLTSIKMQSFLRYGILGYESEVDQYLKSDNRDEGANGLNRVFEAPEDELLLYCGLDSLLEFRVAMDQMQEMGVTP